MRRHQQHNSAGGEIYRRFAKDLERQKANFITLGCVVKRAEGLALRAELLAYVRQCIGKEQ